MALRSTSDLFILDDDASMRDALSLAFTLAGYRVGRFADAEPFLDAEAAAEPGPFGADQDENGAGEQTDEHPAHGSILASLRTEPPLPRPRSTPDGRLPIAEG